MTERQLFLELLHKARELKHSACFLHLPYLEGYNDALKQHLEEIKNGQRIQDYWTHQQAGAE